ncbi:hypothetical protein OG543_08790 [Streptomyces sp. NBC_01178]|uniref:hypothetical protein n=1 Tax=Streptomyces sp. NBC_01178 TaxID=2903762 RepID=UPI00386D506A|nr:hypothetical protein OG543_08790 [Streptomyces sp. NBC_01178]
MSYNQPGPYGGQPPQGQPGPYGQQPGPYGAPPPQGRPGYGYPQQAPQGVPPQQPNPYAQPQQQPGYGYPQAQQPGPYGQQPPGPQYGGQPPHGGQPPYGGPPPQPKKKTGLIIGVAVVALAVIAGGVYFLTSGEKVSNSDVSEATKGYKITPPDAVDAYKRDVSKPVLSAPLTGSEKTEVEALGIKNPSTAKADYSVGTGSAATKVINFQGFWGEIEDPAEVVNNAFVDAEKDAKSGGEDVEIELVGSAEVFEPEGFEGAVMKCQDLRMTNKKADAAAAKGPQSFVLAICVWADYSTAGVTTSADKLLALAGKGVPKEDAAALTAKLYNTARTKI